MSDNERENLLQLLDVVPIPRAIEPLPEIRVPRYIHNEILNCMESIREIVGEYIFSTPTPKEIQLLKPIADFRLNYELPQNAIRRRVNSNRFYVVAGGYAAFVEGRTFDYKDIDIFTNSPGFRRRLFNDDYNGRQFHIENKPPYQYIYTNFRREFNIKEYMEEILQGFDMDICSIAYTRLNDEYIKCVRIKPWTKRSVLKVKPERFFRYAKRSKNVNKLKHLALFTFLKNATPEEKNYFNENIVPSTDFS